METLQLILFEYILGYGLQSFIFIFGIYTFNRQKIDIKKYLLASIISTIIVCLVRLLPISFGVHIIFIMLITIIMCILLLKMPALNSIRSLSILFVLLIISEIVGVTTMSSIFGNDKFGNYMSNPLQRAIIGIPINLLFLLLVTVSYYLLKKKGDFNRKVSS
jgi:CDP-diglyceride synthetase